MASGCGGPSRPAGTRIGQHIVQRWRSGAGLAGSSSGAMVMAAWRQSTRPPFAVHPGFGLLPDVAVAPHHELRVPGAVAGLRARTHPHLVIIGIDEATGLVGRHGRFQVLGVGQVTVRRGTWRRSSTPGSVLELDRFGVRLRESSAPRQAARETVPDPDGRADSGARPSSRVQGMASLQMRLTTEPNCRRSGPVL